MQNHKESVERIVFARLVRLRPVFQGSATGLVAGLGMFLATNWLVLRGGSAVGPHLGLLSQFFLGYRVTFWGSFIGAAYGSAAGFAAGYFVARIYNWVADLRGPRA